MTPEPRPVPPDPGAVLTARVTVVLEPTQGETLELSSAVETTGAGSATAQLRGLPHGWLLAEVKVPGLHRWGLPHGPEEKLVLRDGDAEVLVQRGVNEATCTTGESGPPPPPPGRTFWRVHVLAAAPASFTWSSRLDPGRVVTFTLVLSPATAPAAQRKVGRPVDGA